MLCLWPPAVGEIFDWLSFSSPGCVFARLTGFCSTYIRAWVAIATSLLNLRFFQKVTSMFRFVNSLTCYSQSLFVASLFLSLLCWQFTGLASLWGDSQFPLVPKSKPWLPGRLMVSPSFFTQQLNSPLMGAKQLNLPGLALFPHPQTEDGGRNLASQEHAWHTATVWQMEAIPLPCAGFGYMATNLWLPLFARVMSIHIPDNN